jgi:hypothetical protein
MNLNVIICLLLLFCPTVPQPVRQASLAMGPYRILVLGNSMTLHPPAKSLGWTGNWGMAASGQSKDFVHLLIARLHEGNYNAALQYANVAESFERKYWAFDEKDMQQFRNINPDLLIIRMGENVPVDSCAKYSLPEALTRLAVYITSGNPHARVCITTRFWPSKYMDGLIREAAAKNNWTLIDLSGAAADSSNMAYGKFSNPAVARHPSDAGMNFIYLKIWSSIHEFLNQRGK